MTETAYDSNVQVWAATEAQSLPSIAPKMHPKWVDWNIHRNNLWEVTDQRDCEFFYFSPKDPSIRYKPKIVDPAVYNMLGGRLQGNVTIKGWELCHCDMDPRYASTSIWKLKYEKKQVI